ncbi:DNRLRE domain-containing protein [Streptomyces flaveus]|uniref:DNRLRE domain-containing protein n=1 Tax=Streptomyces flaveus TaxID=66370 RepID=UPI0033325A0F
MSRPARRRRALSHIAMGAALLTAAPLVIVGTTRAVAADGTTLAAAEVKQPSAADIAKADLAWATKHSKGGIPWALAQAKKTGKKVLVPNETTATTLTHANPDGSLTSELTSGPARMQRGGKWVDVDATLTTNADGQVVSKAHPGGLKLAPGGGTPASSLKAAGDATGRDLVTLGSGDGQVTLQWKGGLPKPSLNGTRATYKDAVPGADVVVEATRTGFEQFVDINQRPATSDYSYTLPLRTEGLEAEPQKDGSLTFTDPKTGEKRAVMPAPVMWDATVDKVSGEHTNRHPVDMKVVDKGDGAFDLVVTPDADFLADPDTKYPVTVDPSTSNLSNVFDTYVQQGETGDLSTDVELDFGNPGTTNSDGTPRTARSFITWNTAAFKDAIVTNADVSLWNFHSGNTDCQPQEWTIWDTSASSTTSRWTKQPTWNQQFHSSTQTKGNPSCTNAPDGWITADVTTLVQSWSSALDGKGYMGLRAATDDVKDWKRVNSANATSNPPKLTVTWNYRPGDGTAQQAGAPFKSYAGVWAVNTTTPTLRDKFTDADGDKVNGTFQVYDAATNKPITTPAGEGLIVSDYVAPGSWASVKVPTGQLVDGKTYKFRTNAYDGTHYNLNWSPWREFVVDTTAPGEPTSVSSATYPENWGGGGAGVAGTFDVNTGVSDARDVQYRLDPFEDDTPDAQWSTVAATAMRAVAAENTASFTATPAADGNHVVQTRSVDRADNVGPIRDYGFTAGTRDYNRKQKIDIKLPTPDKDAAAPALTDDPLPALGWKQGSASRTFNKGGMEVTITPKAQRSLEGTRKAAKAAATRAPSYPDPVVKETWCQPTLAGEAQKSLMTRNEACVFLDAVFTATSEPVPGVPGVEYEATFEIAYQVKTDPHADEIKTWIEFNPITNTFPAQDRSVLLGSGDPDAFIDSMCFSDGCDDGKKERKNFDFYGDTNWKGGMNGNVPNDQHMITGTADHKWNGAVDNASGSRDVDLSKGLPVYFVGFFDTDVEPPPLPGGGKGKWEDKTGPWSSPAIEVRCDKVSSNGTPGCVMPQYAPQYRFNTAKYPAAAAHVWMIQNKSKPSKGLGATKPLQYHPGPDRAASGWDTQKSRDVMCAKYQGKRSGGYVPKKTFVNHPKTAMHPELVSSPYPDSISCDEFPFAASYQSPGLPAAQGGTMPAGKNGGGECIQTVAAKTDDGSEHLLDDTRYDPPTWDETCGRSSMSGYVNSGSMSRFGNEFAPQFRLLDKDVYTVAPGAAWFTACDTSKDELICTMKKP